MVSQDTIDIINYSKDIDIEFNLKLILLAIAFIYMLGLFYLTFKWNKDKHYVNFIKTFLIRIPFGFLLALYPLFSIYLFREVSWEWFYNLMLVFYSYALIVMLIAAKLGIFEFAGDLLGLKIKTKDLRVKGKW